MTCDYVIRYIPLYKAALENDWDAAEKFFEGTGEKAAYAQITHYRETPLHIAVGTNSSHRFVENLIERIYPVEKLLTPNDYKTNALHYAAKVGNTRAAKLLVKKVPYFPQIKNKSGHTALKLAAWYAQWEILWYLLSVTEDVQGANGSSHYAGVDGADLFTLSVTADFYDVALYLVDYYPDLVTAKDREDRTGLQTLAAKPDAFRSGCRLSFLQDIIYSCISVKPEIAFHYNMKGVRASYLKNMSRWGSSKDKGAHVLNCLKFGCFQMNVVLWSVLRKAPFIKHIYEMKLMHMQTSQLVKLMCSGVIRKGDIEHAPAWHVLGTALSTAATFGIHELIEECIRSYPDLIWYISDGLSLFHTAIKHRQLKVFNIIYQMSAHKFFATTETPNPNVENVLHTAARVALPHQLNSVPGAALQMQRELKWFKEVEKFIQPSFREVKNSNGQTPKMVFTEEHANLVKKGEKWMKGTASSSMLVAALIVTVAFGAAFKVPGGDNSDGTPLFLKHKVFMVFAISDAIALFSSATSVLMFLSILTSRYTEDDFLNALPKRLTMGLLSLFLSIATTMIAFSATLGIVLGKEIKWIAIPVSLMACLPITLFAFLQFPLLVELVNSTYGRSIFHRESKLLLH